MIHWFFYFTFFCFTLISQNLNLLSQEIQTKENKTKHLFIYNPNKVNHSNICGNDESNRIELLDVQQFLCNVIEVKP